jgi:hypothetical protein
MAGNSFTAADLQNRAGSIVYGVWEALDAARQFKLWLDDATHSDTVLGPLGVGVPSTDLALIRTSYADLGGTSGLWAVARGTYTPTGANNYFFNAKQLSGLNYTG